MRMFLSGREDLSLAKFEEILEQERRRHIDKGTAEQTGESLQETFETVFRRQFTVSR